jgi:hypothetical protein
MFHYFQFKRHEYWHLSATLLFSRYPPGEMGYSWRHVSKPAAAETDNRLADGLIHSAVEGTMRPLKMPYVRSSRKPITPGIHAILDYATVAYFFGVAAGLWKRRRAGAIGALVNGAAVLGLSLMTDYPGGVWRTIPFPTHGKIDAVQAAMAASVPAIGGFADEADSAWFYGQTVNEVGVITFTDWREAGRSSRRRAA